MIREDLRLDHALALAHEHLLHKPVLAKLVLDLLRRDILAVWRDDQVLLAACQEQIAILIDIAEIAGLEPAVCQRFRGLLRHVVVALHDAGTLYPDLLVHDLCLAVRHQPADRAVLHEVTVVRADDRRTLRHAVALPDRDPILLEHFQICRVEVCAAAAHCVKLLAKDFRLDERRRDPCRLLELLCERLDHQRHHQDHVRLKELDVLCHTQQ